MDTNIASMYANLVMAYTDVQIYEQSELMYGLNFHKYLLENWKCYLDDCLILWMYTVELINLKINNNINFTMENSETELSFLDILIIKRDKIIAICYKQHSNNTFFSPHAIPTILIIISPLI